MGLKTVDMSGCVQIGSDRNLCAIWQHPDRSTFSVHHDAAGNGFAYTPHAIERRLDPPVSWEELMTIKD